MNTNVVAFLPAGRPARPLTGFPRIDKTAKESDGLNFRPRRVTVGIERRRELRRRRSRRKKVAVLKRKADSANPSEKTAIAGKLRGLTPGAQELIERWGLEERA